MGATVTASGAARVARVGSSDSQLAELLVLVAAGDSSAFSSLYKATSAQVLAVVRRQLVDLALSEEVRQDVYLEIWQQATRFSHARGAAMVWICVIARRRAIDRVRAVHASRRRDRISGIREWTPPYDQVSERMEFVSEFGPAATALRGLPQLQQDAIELVYGRGLSSVEAAAVLCVAPGTVRTRVRDGLLRLRASLGVAA